MIYHKVVLWYAGDNAQPSWSLFPYKNFWCIKSDHAAILGKLQSLWCHLLLTYLWSLSPLMTIISQQNFAHDTPAQLSCHVQNFLFIVRRAGLLWSQQDFEWRWSVPLFKCLTVLEFSFILFYLFCSIVVTYCNRPVSQMRATPGSLSRTSGKLWKDYLNCYMFWT